MESAPTLFTYTRTVFNTTGLVKLEIKYTYDVIKMSFGCQGNYDTYVKTRSELEEHQMKRYHWEQDQMQHMKVPGLHSIP